MPIPDYYCILEISRYATEAEIKQAFRKQAKQYHPDKNPEQKKSAERMFRRICIAYEILRDSQRKLKYDLTLKAADREQELYFRPFEDLRRSEKNET
jgi:DnaJ-class molecular chaperone